MRIDTRCQRCGLEGESTNHVIFTCVVARQTWALSNFPNPENGFDKASVYENLHTVVVTSKRRDMPSEIVRAWPWIVWMLWKNRNNFIFEGLAFQALQTLEKIKEDMNQWFMAQQCERVNTVSESTDGRVTKVKWSPPLRFWLKCNLGSVWNNRNQECGAAWVLRNSKGRVMLHSRKSFPNIPSYLDANVVSLSWAIESMVNIKVSKVIFGLEANDLIGAINRPPAWPSYKFLSNRLLGILNRLPHWLVKHEDRAANKGAYL